MNQNNIGMVQFNIRFDGIYWKENVENTIYKYFRTSPIFSDLRRKNHNQKTDTFFTYNAFGPYHNNKESIPNNNMGRSAWGFGRMLVCLPMSKYGQYYGNWFIVFLSHLLCGLLTFPVTMAKCLQCLSCFKLKTIDKVLVYDVHFRKMVVLQENIVPIAFIHGCETCANKQCPEVVKQVIHEYIGELIYEQTDQPKTTYKATNTAVAVIAT